MTASNLSDRITNASLGQQLLPLLVELAVAIKDSVTFRQKVISQINESCGAGTSVIVRGVKGTWRTIAEPSDGDSANLPLDFFSEVLDEGRFSVQQDWTALPLEVPNTKGRLLAQQFTGDATISAEDADSVAAAFLIADSTFRNQREANRRADRLHAILEMTSRWNQTRETDQLLVEIAEASTRLLGSERATIFLPDASGKSLVGKPALGVESGQITIPAGIGVVGSVIESGTPQRVDSDIAAEQRQINREVDAELNFETRSLLCVPLVNSNEQTIGAFELINKIHGNFTDEDQEALVELAAHASVAIENTQRVEQLESTTKVVADEAADQVQLIGNCGQIDELKSTIERVAHTDLAILITGENGTGKEVVAQLIHYLSDRRDKVLVAVNCAAITESLLESELFGHEKGAFTDAHQARAGKFELADKGTLFLDEIGNMSLGGQAKLLRVLEEKVVVRVGGSTTIPTSARVVAATNQNLAELVKQKKFREDLFFRLNVVTLEIPPLRDRGEDILLLAEHFNNEFCKKSRRPVLKLSAAAKKKLLLHLWPGNVRELRNMMERLAYLSPGDTVEPDDLAFVNSPRSDDDAIVPMDLSLTEASKHFQRDYIQRHIDRTRGNMTDAAGSLGLHRSNLYRKMRQLGMSGPAEDEAEDGS